MVKLKMGDHYVEVDEKVNPKEVDSFKKNVDIENTIEFKIPTEDNKNENDD